MAETMEEIKTITIGRIGRPHGLYGEVSIIPLTDNPDRFSLLSTVTLVLNNDDSRQVEIEKVQNRGSKITLKFARVDDRTSAEELRGAYIEIPIEACLPLEENTFYVFDLIGLDVITVDEDYIGKVTEVLSLPANDVYVVQNKESEFLIPAISDVVKKIDIDGGKIVIELMDGLLE